MTKRFYSHPGFIDVEMELMRIRSSQEKPEMIHLEVRWWLKGESHPWESETIVLSREQWRKFVEKAKLR